MTDLSKKYLEAVAFETKRAVEVSKEPYNANPSDNMFIGIKRESDRRQPLDQAVAELIRACEALNTQPNQLFTNMAKLSEALTALEKAIEGNK